MVSRRFALAALGVAAALGLVPATAGAVPFNPSDFDLISPNPVSGHFAVDTDALTFGGFSGEERDGVAVFALAGGSGLGNLTVTGSRPLAILFQGLGGVMGTIDISGGDGMDEPAPGFGGPGGQGVAGGFHGGGGGVFSPGADGGGPGGGEGENSIGGGIANFGGAGGGFGGRGGNSGGIGTAQGGDPYGDLALALTGGSGGGGGGGKCCFATDGGALEIGANGLLVLLGAIIDASGGDGGPGLQGGGGGSGGGVLLHGFSVVLSSDAFIDVSGGDGAKFGGCGGGGRVHIETNTGGVSINAGLINTSAGFGCFDTIHEGIVSGASSDQMGLALAQASASIPEPGGAAVFGLGLAGVFAAGRRRTAKR